MSHRRACSNTRGPRSGIDELRLIVRALADIREALRSSEWSSHTTNRSKRPRRTSTSRRALRRGKHYASNLLRSTLCPMRKAALLARHPDCRSPHGPSSAAPPTPIATGRRTRATKASTKYSPLDQINKDTIKNLRIAWTRSGLPEELRASFPDAQAPANYQHTPLVVGGVHVYEFRGRSRCRA